MYADKTHGYAHATRLPSRPVADILDDDPPLETAEPPERE